MCWKPSATWTRPASPADSTSDEVVDAHGRPLSTTTALGAAEFIWYYRTLPQEPVLPVTERILYEDEHLVVADKPPFLPTTPAGRYVQQSLLVRLRNSLGLDELTPIHRLDRGTAGLVLFAERPPPAASTSSCLRTSRSARPMSASAPSPTASTRRALRNVFR